VVVVDVVVEEPPQPPTTNVTAASDMARKRLNPGLRSATIRTYSTSQTNVNLASPHAPAL
jgi:hypothetical protein